MLYHFLYSLSEWFSPLNLFRYLTFRTGGAIFTSMLIVFCMGSHVIDWLKSYQAIGQPIRSDGPENHILHKQGTPTMGGILILLAVMTSTWLWCDLSNGYVWTVLWVTIGFGAVGFIDDRAKLIHQSSKGISARYKIGLQAAVALIAVIAMINLTTPPLSSSILVPFFKDFLIDLGWAYVPFAVFVMLGASNAVNLTDGLDGLAVAPVMIACLCYAVIAYLTGNIVFANYLRIGYVPGTGELMVFCGAVIGAGLGFLWYNAPPAMVFMGDTGSLSLGGALGIIALISKHELVLPVIGGLFVLETVSVIVQVVSFRLTGQRVFRMAPLHHHFEKRGWAESTIVIRFWIISIILALVGLATLKIR